MRVISRGNICLGLFLSALAHGGELTVRNGDFETPQAAESNEVGEWHESRVGKLLGGYLLAQGSKDLPDTPDGKQWLELIGQPNIPADVYQQIGTWEAGKYCTVSLLIGNRGILADSGLRLELWVGGDAAVAQPGKALDQIGARLLSEASNIGLPPNGETFPVTRSLASGDKGKPGEPLWLRLVQHGDLETNAVVLIDNVTAKWTDEAVEPAKETLPENPTPVANANSPYVVRDIPVPEGVVVEAGGVCYWPDGTLLVATRRGDVWTVKDGRWNLFATGLMEPMGIWADTVGEVFVTQAPELTRIQDLDGDLSADRYGTVTAGWDMPGARTDFVFGLCRDSQGNFYGTMHTTHAPWAEAAKKSKLGFGGPMGAPVIGRGWSFQVDPKGKLTWWSSGLRAPNGLGFNAEGDLFCAENQGDWVGTSALHHIKQGDFHGHPSSYNWDPKRTVSLEGPLNELAAKLDPIRKRPVVLFPHGILGNSPSQPVLAPADGTFGPFAGQFFVGDNVAPLVSRVFLEKIDGEYQGACFPFIREQGLRKALSRMTFSPEGKLVIEFGCRGWGPATVGLQEVSWSGETPFEMQTINLQSDGFRITFTKPLAEQGLEKAVSIKSYRYKYHHLYGSPQVDVEQSQITGISVSQDRRVVTLLTSPLKAGKIYEFALKGVTAADGEPLANPDAYYTANKLSEVSSTEASVSLTGGSIIPIATTTPGTKKPAGEWAFFPFCMDQHDSKKRDLAAQAKLFRELGYDGAGHLSQEFGYAGVGTRNVTVEQRAETLAAEGLRLVHTYARVFLDKETPIDLKRLAEAMPTLAKHRSQLILLFVGNRKADLDDKAVAILGQIADIAKPHGVTVAIYPHNKDYTQTIGEALRLVKKLNRPKEVGVMFTFFHWQAYDANRDLRAVLAEAAPYLKSVGINGSNNAKASVLPLAQGDYDNRVLLDILRDLDFKGPVGLMCWGLGGDSRDHLAASMEKWKSLTAPK